MDKKEYVANQIKKTFGKKYENYCVNRIITKLDNFDVRFITQQMFRREDGDIALADLYFPQVNVLVEIDEDHSKQTEEDDIRTDEINKYSDKIKTKLKNLEEVIDIVDERIIDRIEIYNDSRTISLEEINKRIDEIVDKINKRIVRLGDKFVPWTEIYNKANEFIEKGSIEKKDNARFKTLQDVSELFNKGYRGNRLAYFPINKKNHEYVCCPKIKINDEDFKNNKYVNEISNDGKYIFEFKKENNNEFIKKTLEKPQTRYVFVKYKNEIGESSYKFFGVFVLDPVKTKDNNKVTWKKISEKIILTKYFN